MLSIVLMNKRSILTAVLALGLGISALTGCATDSDSAHSYVTPKEGVKVPEARDLKVTLPESDKASDYKVEVSDPATLSVGKPNKNVITLHPLQVTGEDADPVTVTITDKDGITTDFKVTVTEGAN